MIKDKNNWNKRGERILLSYREINAIKKYNKHNTLNINGNNQKKFQKFDISKFVSSILGIIVIKHAFVVVVFIVIGIVYDRIYLVQNSIRLIQRLFKCKKTT